MIIDLIGWAGGICILSAYYLVASKRHKGNSSFIQLLNLVGALFLILNAYTKGAFPFVFLNSIWAAIAVKTLIKP